MKTLLLAQILAIVLPGVFSDNMIFQQGRDLPVWGQASASETVNVILSEEADGSIVAKVRTKADKQGRWSVSLPSLEAEGQSLKLTVSGRKDKTEFSNIAVGEVWVCSGQSNMAYEMRRTWQAPPRKGDDLTSVELQKPANPLIRVFFSSRGGNSWKVADGESLAPVSAAGYFFAKNVSEALGVPVGIISAAVGGSAVEQWLSDGNLYKSLLQPYAPFAVAGFLWYQGETNCSQRDHEYVGKFRALTSTWRSDFNAPDAPFFTVMLCPHTFSDRLHRNTRVTSEELPVFWQQQIKAACDIPGCDIISITDLVDNLEDIHPSYKWTVGERLANVALARHYRIEGAPEYSGPRAVSKRVGGDKVTVTFDHAEGLMARANSVEPKTNAQLKWFEVAGVDRAWRQAFAIISGDNEVSVFHPDVPNPVYVRYAWHETAQPNLFNAAGLPAFPFEM